MGVTEGAETRFSEREAKMWKLKKEDIWGERSEEREKESYGRKRGS